jgi:hypothetical protein
LLCQPRAYQTRAIYLFSSVKAAEYLQSERASERVRDKKKKKCQTMKPTNFAIQIQGWARLADGVRVQGRYTVCREDGHISDAHERLDEGKGSDEGVGVRC